MPDSFLPDPNSPEAEAAWRLSIEGRLASLKQRDIGNQVLGYVQQLGPPAGTSQHIVSAGFVALTGLSLTVVVGTRRLLRITAFTTARIIAGGGTIGTRVVEGATVLQIGATTIPSAGDNVTNNVPAIVAPTPGTHTYFVDAKSTTGEFYTPIDNWSAGLQNANYLLIEDIGQAPA